MRIVNNFLQRHYPILGVEYQRQDVMIQTEAQLDLVDVIFNNIANADLEEGINYDVQVRQENQVNNVNVDW